VCVLKSGYIEVCVCVCVLKSGYIEGGVCVCVCVCLF
jgi:hypothetical protein